MFRLMQQDKADGILITIEGELRGDSVGIAESACRDALASNSQVTILIKNVTEIDADGHEFLRRAASAKARLRAIGIYSRYVIKRIGALPLH